MFTIKINSHYTNHSHYLFRFAIVPLYFIIQIPSATKDIDNCIYHRNYFVLYRYILYRFIYPWFAICFITTIHNTNTIIRFYINLIFLIKYERDCSSILSFFSFVQKQKSFQKKNFSIVSAVDLLLTKFVRIKLRYHVSLVWSINH